MLKDDIPSITLDDVEELRDFIRTAAKKTGCDGMVIGLSGGLDSAVVTKLTVDAIGADKVLNVFMPSRVTPAEDYKVTADLCRRWGTEYKVVDIQPAVDSLVAILTSNDDVPLERGNIAARCRMVVLYNQAKKRNYLVMGTSNQSELMMGYFTKFGDGACDITPLANIYKMQVRQIAKMVGVPEDIITKPPTAGLWEGQTDEDEMGVRYCDLDRILYGFEMERTDKEIASFVDLPVEDVVNIRSRVKKAEHKRLQPTRPGSSVV